MASSSPARPRARETASFMKPTWRRTAWPSEAAFCSAMRSGSARRMATSVMVEDLRRSSSVRQASRAISHSIAMGTTMAAMVRNVVGRVTRSSRAEHRRVGADRGERERDADGRPDDAGDGGELERRVRRLLLQREDEAADAGAVVVGGDAVARGAGGPAACHAPARRGVGRALASAGVVEERFFVGRQLGGGRRRVGLGVGRQVSDAAPGRGGGNSCIGGVCLNGGSLPLSASVVLGALPSAGSERVGSGRTSPSSASSCVVVVRHCPVHA